MTVKFRVLSYIKGLIGKWGELYVLVEDLLLYKVHVQTEKVGHISDFDFRYGPELLITYI